MEVGGHRKIGRPKLRWSSVIRKDMKEEGVKIEVDRRRRLENVEIENSTRRPQLGKRPKKQKIP